MLLCPVVGSSKDRAPTDFTSRLIAAKSTPVITYYCHEKPRFGREYDTGWVRPFYICDEGGM
jgi:hypothetical protein